ncbi:MAG: hypothetical protein ACWA5T_09585 [Parvularcula sp.]
MRAGLPLSVLLHIGIAAAILHVWKSSDHAPLFVPSIPVEIFTEAELGEILSVPEEVKVDEPTEPEAPMAPAEEELPPPEPEVAPEEPQQDETPPPPPEEPPEEKAPDPEPPKPEPPKPEPKPVKPEPPKKAVDELDFSEFEKALENLDPDKKDTRSPRVISDNAVGSDRNVEGFGEGSTLTIREADLLRAKLYACWNPDLGAPDAGELLVQVDIFLNIDGTLRRVDVINDGEINRSGNPYWAAARTRATQAVETCEPYDLFDPARYDEWKTIRFNFKPDEY